MRPVSRSSSKSGNRRSSSKRASFLTRSRSSSKGKPDWDLIGLTIEESPSPEKVLADKRKQFEDESRQQNLLQVREQRQRRGFDESQKAKLLQLMMKHGDGSIRIAWRRHFDQDGDGDLDFGEFCQGLCKIGYIGDVISLWRELGGVKENCITLQAVDYSGAEIVGYFSNWCAATFPKGPFEFFTKLDDDDSNSLTAEEFADGLEEYGFFKSTDLPERISTRELALANLFPFLDADGQGSIAAQDILFLEKDKDKRDAIKFEFLHKEMLDKYGEEVMNPLPKEAYMVLKEAESELLFAAFHEELPERRRLRRPGSAPMALRARPANGGRTAASALPLLGQPQPSGKPVRPASGTRLARTR